MKIRLSDLGRVKNADIVLDGITVVAGNNGSGKSTISKGLYTIFEAFYDINRKVKQQRARSIVLMARQWYFRIPREVRESVPDLYEIRQILRDENLDKETFFMRVEKVFYPVKSENIFIYIEQLYEMYNELYHKTAEQYQNYIAQLTVDEVFARQPNTLNHNSSGEIECLSDDIHMLEIKHNEVIQASGQEQFIQPIYITTSDLIDTVGNNNKLRSAQQLGSVSYANAQLVELLMKETSAKDFTIEEYECLQRQRNQADCILQQVLEGDIHLEKNNLVYYDDWAEGNIAFGNVASGVRIFLILKRLIYNGTFLKPSCLIIDEPETNLHPEWQLRLAELLVLMYKNMKIKVYVNTHSPYFARAIEFYAHKYNELDVCRFYLMKSAENDGMYVSEDVTEKLGVIYDMLAEPFNKIM